MVSTLNFFYGTFSVASEYLQGYFSLQKNESIGTNNKYNGTIVASAASFFLN